MQNVGKIIREIMLLITERNACASSFLSIMLYVGDKWDCLCLIHYPFSYPDLPFQLHAPKGETPCISPSFYLANSAHLSNLSSEVTYGIP